MLKKLQDWLLPTACILCGKKAEEAQDLCHPCKLDLPWLNASCQQCAIPLSFGTSGSVCGACLQKPPPFTQTIALFEYLNPIDKLIMGIKFRKNLVYARLLSQLFIERLENTRQIQLPECIIPVPLHTSRLRERGFNQTVELARVIAKKFQIPLDIHSCQRLIATETQAALPAAQRQANMRGAFGLTKKIIEFKHVAVFDDVVTTGQTATELTNVLKQAGVERVDVWCCARTNFSK